MPTLFGRQPFLPLDLAQFEPGFAQPFDISFEYPRTNIPDAQPMQPGYLTPASGSEFLSANKGSEDNLNALPGTGLPDGDTLVDLMNIFFESFYHVFPCFHKATFLADIRNQQAQAHSPLILLAMCCVASSHHPDTAIKNRQSDWYEQAKFLYELTGRDPQPALRTMQAVLCLAYHAYTRGDFSACWLHLGKAWRQAAALGMNRIDSPHAVMMALNRLDLGVDTRGYYNRLEWSGATDIEREECRRTLWLLFFMDRNQTWPTGWPHAIDERQFKVDIPVPEAVFQAMGTQGAPKPPRNAVFTPNMNSLIASLTRASSMLNMMHCLVAAHVLLGRVTEHIHSLHDPPDTVEYAERCDELDEYAVKLRLSLPRSATSVIESSTEDRGHVVWLNCILNTISILLNYRRANDSEPSTSDELFKKAVIAAKNTAQIVKDAARVSIELLLSAHIGSSLYLAAVVLVIHSRLTGDESVKGDIELFALVFERMNDVVSVMGVKFTLALRRDLERNKEELERLREIGYRGLLADCSKWGFVQEEVTRMGMTMS